MNVCFTTCYYIFSYIFGSFFCLYDQSQSLVIVTLLSFEFIKKKRCCVFFSCRDIVSLAGRLRKRPDGRPVYTVDGSDEDADFDLNKDPTTEQIEGLAERDAVCLYLNVKNIHSLYEF